MLRLLTIAAAFCLAVCAPAAARPVMPDGSGIPRPQLKPVDTEPWLVQAFVKVTVAADGSISLTDENDVAISTLSPGWYGFWIRDWSTAANFHLTGLTVDRISSVPGTGYDAWRVLLVPGSYRFFSDTSPDAGGSFAVPGYFRL